ncbi:MAG TPA: hypothetical protein VF786_13840, partial [Terriglobales bacterium]
YMVAPKLRKLSTGALLVMIVLSFVAFLFKAPRSTGLETLENWRVLVVTSWMWMIGFLYFRLRRTPLGFTILAFPATLSLALGRNWGLPLLFSVFVLIMSTEISVSGKAGTFFNFLGDVSYPLYLFHLPAMMALLAFGFTNSFVLLLAPLTLALLVLKTIDLPIRSRFSRMKQNRVSPEEVAPSDDELLALSVEVGAEAGD